MGGTVIPGEPAPVHAEDDRQILQANVVHDGVKGALQESRVNGAEGAKAHGRQAGGKDDPVRLVFTASPGPAVVIGLLDLGERFRLVANVVDVTSPDEDLPRLPVARAVWEPRPDLMTAAQTWLSAGGPHHTCLTLALGMEAFIDFAEIAGIELAVIDDETKARQFDKELRWNDLHYLLRGN